MTKKINLTWERVPVIDPKSDIVLVEKLVLDQSIVIAQLWKHSITGNYLGNYYDAETGERVDHNGSYSEVTKIVESNCRAAIEKDRQEGQKQLTFTKRSAQEAAFVGYPMWNDCNHYTVDMSHLQSRTEDYQNTISIKLPNGNAITVCIMQTSKDETSVDTAFHGNNIKSHRVMGFGGEGKDETIHNKNIYALIATANEIK